MAAPTRDTDDGLADKSAAEKTVAGAADKTVAGAADKTVAGAARGTALNLVGSILSAIIGFVTVGLITNRYGPEGSGLFFAATALFTLAANSARLGSESGLTWFVARVRTDDRHATLPGVVGRAVGWSGLAAAVLAGLGVWLAPVAAGLMTDDVTLTESATRMIRILAFAVPSFTLSQALIGASRGFGTMRPAVLAGQIVRPSTQLLAVAVALWASDETWTLAAAWTASSLATLLVIALWVGRRLRVVRAKQGSAEPVGSGPAWVEYRRFAVPRALADTVSAALERLDVLLVAVLVGEAGAGLYGATGRLILAGQLMMIATAQSMAPLLSSAFTSGRLDEAERVLRTITGWNVTLLWPAFIGLAFGSSTVLSFFGPEFAEAWPLVVVLSIAMMLILALGAGDTLLTMTGDSRGSLINHVVSLVVMIAVAVTLLPTVGIVGAAWAWAASRLTLRGLAVWRVWRGHGIHAGGRQVAVGGLVCLAIYVPTGIGALLVFGPGPAAIAAHALIGGLVHLGVLTRLRSTLELDLLLPVLTRRS